MTAETYTEPFKKGILAVLLVILAVLLGSNVARAGDVSIENRQLGSGTPGQVTTEDGMFISKGADGDIYHAPQYMPNYPTAAPIWPRVVEVECTKNTDGTLSCDGYTWQPKYGRGEYIFFHPKIKKPTACCLTPPVVIYKEVPVKPGKQ